MNRRVEYTTADYLLQAVDEDTAGTDGDDESEEDEKAKDKRTETKEVSFTQRECTVFRLASRRTKNQRLKNNHAFYRYRCRYPARYTLCAHCRLTLGNDLPCVPPITFSFFLTR